MDYAPLKNTPVVSCNCLIPLQRTCAVAEFVTLPHLVQFKVSADASHAGSKHLCDLLSGQATVHAVFEVFFWQHERRTSPFRHVHAIDFVSRLLPFSTTFPGNVKNGSILMLLILDTIKKCKTFAWMIINRAHTFHGYQQFTYKFITLSCTFVTYNLHAGLSPAQGQCGLIVWIGK